VGQLGAAPALLPKDDPLRKPLNNSSTSPLTPRERDVLQLAADDISAPRIAQHLSLSRATVNTHFGHIYVKLDVNSRAGAVAKAIRLGLIR
jgi:DNA-binding CsgD family transcriptional regulator